ncbi:MAG: metal ABC transporter solute-binding protein, Zn/Mn family [Anaerolineales bacterium]|jgi:ABC-type Zn uptake system ZnuABC Zn-binding protein ZnuA
MIHKLNSTVGFLLLAVVLLAACSPAKSQASGTSTAAGGPKVVATTTIVGDVAQQVAGDQLEVTTLLPAGSDPHSFQPTPQDITQIASADLIFTNGFGLESFLNTLLENKPADTPVVAVSDGIQPLAGSADHAGEADSAQSAQDPHVWTDPNNVLIWVDNITAALQTLDPDHASDFAANAAAYRQQLKQLDAWVRQQVAQVPASNRLLVTDHATFAYFAERYQFQQVGAVVPGFSTLSEPSAQELAALEDQIRQLGVKAIFVGDTVNPNLSERVAEDTGIQIVFLHTGSLTGPDGSAPTYLDYIRYNVNAIVSALK